MPTSAHIFQINTSQGGVPKHPQAEGQVTLLGLANDDHAHPNIHGGPERALCLYSLELITMLQAEGHPVYPGSLGENITVTGLDWAQVVPGARLRLGDQVLVEVTRYTTPCNTIVASFADRDTSRISHEKHPGWSRVYARVVQAGTIHVGDRVTLVE